MTILDTVLFFIVATLVTLKVALLAAAAILLLRVLTRRIHQPGMTPAPVPVRHPRQDGYA